MKLIIAGNPGLAKLIAKAIGDTHCFDGYFKNNEYIITYVFKHLFELYSIEDYLKDKSEAWTLNILPFVPQNNNFSFKLVHDKKANEPNADIHKQFNIINQLCNRKDVSVIINCGDFSSKGEALIRLVIRNSISWNSKKIYRLWLNEQTTTAVRMGLKNLRPEFSFDNIANEGFAQMYENWLYGINCTRYATVKSGGALLRISRALTTIVKEIYDRDMDIKNFIPDKYYSICSFEETNGNIISLEDKIKFNIGQETDALERCGLLNTHGATVTDIKKEQIIIDSPKLFKTDTIQNAANELYNFSPDKTSHILQRLYENGFITYPYVNTEYLASSDKNRIKSLLNTFCKNGYNVIYKDIKSIFDDSKTELHSAITPTFYKPGNLGTDERYIYELIKNRFIAVFFAEKCVINRTTLKIYCYDEEFVLKGDICVQEGYLKHDFNKITENELPDLSIGDKVKIHFCFIENETTPPPRYTVTSFNNFMVSPLKTLVTNNEINDEYYKELLNGAEIGTPISRASIIKKALENGYIRSDGTHYFITPLGIELIRITQELGINLYKDKSVKVSRMLKSVLQGKISVNDYIDNIMQDINNMFLNKNVQIRPVSV